MVKMDIYHIGRSTYQTIWQLLCQNEDDRIIEFVKQNIDNPSIKETFHTAICSKQIKLAELMIKAGVNVNHFDKHGMSPLLTACDRDDTLMVKLLLENGTDVNATDPYGCSVMSFANSEEVIDILQKYGGKFLVNNKTPYGVASSNDAVKERLYKVMKEEWKDVQYRMNQRMELIVSIRWFQKREVNGPVLAKMNNSLIRAVVSYI